MTEEERQIILQEIKSSSLFSDENKRKQEQYIKQVELLLNNADEKSFLSQRRKWYSLEEIKKDLDFYISFFKWEHNSCEDFDLFNLVADRLNKSWILNVNKKAYNELMLKILGDKIPKKVINILNFQK
jgi:hypothetical protein